MSPTLMELHHTCRVMQYIVRYITSERAALIGEDIRLESEDRCFSLERMRELKHD